jgi:hypothetical protein
MMLSGGGRLYVEFVSQRGDDDPFTRDNHLRTLSLGLVVKELKDRGATVVHREVVTGDSTEQSPGVTTGHRTGRLVVEWQR